METQTWQQQGGAATSIPIKYLYFFFEAIDFNLLKNNESQQSNAWLLVVRALCPLKKSFLTFKRLLIWHF